MSFRDQNNSSNLSTIERLCNTAENIKGNKNNSNEKKLQMLSDHRSHFAGHRDKNFLTGKSVWLEPKNRLPIGWKADNQERFNLPQSFKNYEKPHILKFDTAKSQRFVDTLGCH